MSQDVGIDIKVNYSSLTAAKSEAGKLRDELVNVGKTEIPINASFATAPAAIAAQYNNIVQASLTKLLGKPGGAWATDPGGNRVYTSPGGVQYGGVRPPPSPAPPPSQENDSQSSGQALAANSMRRMLTGVLALAGAGGIISELFKGMEIYKQTAIAEGQLIMRGGGPDRRISWGYGPLDVARQDLEAAQIAGGPGAAGRGNLARMASRAMGMDSPDTVISYMTEAYKKTGEKDIKEQTKLLGKMYEMQKRTGNLVSAETFFTDSRRMLTTIAAGVGNVQLAGGAGFAQTLLANMYGYKGIGAQAPGLIEKINRSMSGGGADVGTQTLAWAAVGGFNGDPMTAKRHRELRAEIEKGLKSPKYLSGLNQWINKMGSSKEYKQELWQNQLGLTTTEANEFMEYMNSGSFEKAQKENLSFEAGVAKHGTSGMQAAAKKAMSTEGGKQATTAATEQMRDLKVGQALKPEIDKFKNAVNEFVIAVANNGMKGLGGELKALNTNMGWLGKGVTALVGLTAYRQLGGNIGAKALMQNPAAKAALGFAGDFIIPGLAAAYGLQQTYQAVTTGKSDVNGYLNKYLPKGLRPDDYIDTITRPPSEEESIAKENERRVKSGRRPLEPDGKGGLRTKASSLDGERHMAEIAKSAAETNYRLERLASAILTNRVVLEGSEV